MIDRDRIQLARSKNSRLSSSRSGVVPQHAKPFVQPSTPHFARAEPAENPHNTTHYARFYHHLQPILWTSTPTHQSKPIAHAPCSGLVQSIFRSPARLRSRFLSAYACCSHAANLKMLCILVNVKYYFTSPITRHQIRTWHMTIPEAE